MIKEDFQKLIYFNYNEKDYKGNYIFHDEKVLKMTKFKLMKRLDIIRDAIGFPIILHCTYEPTGHTKHSYHYLGMAADFHFQTEIRFLEQVENLLDLINKLNWKVGCGVYPCWKHKGFHFDIRGYTARWVRIDNVYYPFKEGMEKAKGIVK